MIDYHVHTSFCGHASGFMEEYVVSALDKGLGELGFAGHYPYPEGYDPGLDDCVIPREDFPAYLEEAFRLKQKYAGRIGIGVGAEFDWLGESKSLHPLHEATRLGLDFALMSVHIVDDRVIDWSPEHSLAGLDNFGGDPDRMYERYFETLEAMLEPGCCTTVAHLDLVKKFCSVPGLAARRDHGPLVDRVLDRIAGAGLVLEINTSGWDKPCAEQYPSYEILEGAVARGIRLTAGSDAHAPEEVGRHFGRLKELLHGLGVGELTAFEGLEAVAWTLPG